MNVLPWIERARHSAFHRALLNLGLQRMIPFNKPHGLRVSELGQYFVKIVIPYKRKNLNHIRGLHACVLATASEYATGFVLLSNLGFEKYRIIMQRMEMDYHYQGKMEAVAEFSITADWLKNTIVDPLATRDAVVVTCEIKTHDAEGKHLTTGKVFWQIKTWSAVKTKVAL